MKKQKMLLGALIVVLCLVLVAAVYWQNDTPTVEVPHPEVTLQDPHDPNVCMIGYFVYNDRVYMSGNAAWDTGDIIDSHLGTATGLLNFWTKADGYVDWAGSYEGEIYTVQGFDPDFVVCTKHNNGQLQYFVSRGGISLRKGEEWFEDRLHLTERLQTVQRYDPSGANYYAHERQVAEDFLKALGRARCIGTDTSVVDPYFTAGTGYEQIDFVLDNGLEISLLCFDDGTVMHQDWPPLLFKMQPQDYSRLMEALDQDTEAQLLNEEEQYGYTETDCRADPMLGGYLPTYMPENVLSGRGYIQYYLNAETGKETGTREVSLEYNGRTSDAVGYSVTIGWAEDYGVLGWAGPMLDAAEVSEEALSAYVETTTHSGRPVYGGNQIDIGVYFDDMMVHLSGWGIDEKDAYAIISSIPAFDKYR